MQVVCMLYYIMMVMVYIIASKSVYTCAYQQVHNRCSHIRKQVMAAFLQNHYAEFK